jgi:hypothetical protein
MSVARVVDGETYADSTYMNTLVDAVNNGRAGVVNVLDHPDADPTGVADSFGAVSEMATDAMADGKTLSLAGQTFRMSQSLELDDPIIIDGGGWYEDPGTNLLYGGQLVFDSGVPGVIFGSGARRSRLSNIAISSQTNDFDAPALSGSETDDGVVVQAPYVYLDHVGIRFFGRRGINADTSVAGNANLGYASHLDSSFNGKQGIYLVGPDSNAWQINHANVVGNGEEGILNRGLKNTFIAPHAEANDGDTSSSYDYNDGGSASVWINPYSEAGHRFLIDTPQVTCFNGMIQSGGTSGQPVIWSGAGPSEGIFAAAQAAWFVQFGNIVQNRLTIKDTAAGAHEMAIYGDWSPEAIVFGDRTSALAILSLFGSAGNPRVVANQHLVMDDGKNITFDTTTGTKIGTAASQKLAFYNATPIVQPTGVAVSTAGIHAALVSLGLITA